MEGNNEEKILMCNRGKIIIKNSEVKCYLGDTKKMMLSEDIMIKLKDNKEKKKCIEYTVGGENYIIIYPIPTKKISIITNNGKTYKSTIFFIDNIKNIISCFKLNNPCYKYENKYNKFESNNDYKKVLYNNKINEIKDVNINLIDFEKLKNDYENNEKYYKENSKNDFVSLKTINQNIEIYTKIDNIAEENYYITESRNSQTCELDEFYYKADRNNISNIIYGMFGNYASGKSTFLMNYNFESEFPSIYLNLKVLKNSLETEGFTKILNNELMIFFFKLKKKYNDFELFIKQLIPFEGKQLDYLILLIVEQLKKYNGVIIFDQYQNSIFNPNVHFIQRLKKILYDEKAQIKIVISNSMNDKHIREIYINLINNNFNEEKNNNEDNKYNDYIPYHFVEKLIDPTVIIEELKQNESKNNQKLMESLQLFNFLPLYYNLCKQNINDLDSFISKTKNRIEQKIKDFLKNYDYLEYIDAIRKIIDNEISIDDFNFYNKWIPFKYFYVDFIGDKMFLKTHFELINEVWINIVIEKTVKLFDGEIDYNGNVIGSLLEINLVKKITDKKINILNIDSFIEVDTINNMGLISKKDTNEFENKNIFITQKNQNGKNFDMGYIKGKETIETKFVYIQVKKSYSKNRVTLQQTKMIFEEKKKQFQNLFGFIPSKCYLVYISLVNNKIKNAFLTYDNYKNDKIKKISDLNPKISSIVYSINELYNFCNQNDIQLYYFDPNMNIFYIRNNNNFESSELNLFIEKERDLKIVFDYSFYESSLEKNKYIATNINNEYLKFKRKNKRKDEKFIYILDSFNISLIFDFANEFFNNPLINSYINLKKTQLNWQFYNLSKKKAILCIKKNNNKKYEVKALIYNNLLLEIDKNNNFLFKKTNNNSINSGYDYLIIISFDNLTEKGNKLLIK